jgi:lipoate-protein ligase B
VNLRDFELINACGMPGVISTSIAAELGDLGPPSTESVEHAARLFADAFAREIGATLRAA